MGLGPPGAAEQHQSRCQTPGQGQRGHAAGACVALLPTTSEVCRRHQELKVKAITHQNASILATHAQRLLNSYYSVHADAREVAAAGDSLIWRNIPSYSHRIIHAGGKKLPCCIARARVCCGEVLGGGVGNSLTQAVSKYEKKRKKICHSTILFQV